MQRWSRPRSSGPSLNRSFQKRDGTGRGWRSRFGRLARGGLDRIFWSIGPRVLLDREYRFPPSYYSTSTLTPPSLHRIRRRLERQAAIPSALQTPGGNSALSPPKTPAESASDPALGAEFASTEFAGDVDVSSLKAALTEVDMSSEAMEHLPDVRELDENFDTAFQLAMNRGPLCAEPVVGMAYFLEAVELHSDGLDIATGTFHEPLVCQTLMAYTRSFCSAVKMVRRTRAADLGRPGRLPKRLARLVAATSARHVLVRYPSDRWVLDAAVVFL